MKVENTNFCRQMLIQFLPYAGTELDTHGIYLDACKLATRAEKFALPYTGRLIEDKQFRALDENEPLRLPYPVIALEFFSDMSGAARGEETSSKRIVLASEEDDAIYIHAVWFFDRIKRWVCFAPFTIPKTGYLDRAVIVDGQVAMNVQVAQGTNPNDLTDDLGCILGFLNALQCSNVRAEKIPLGKSRKAIKAALPFDEYHVLMIDSGGGESENSSGGAGTHRSPREHLRRGHIRRLETGKKIWVNAAIINAGKIGGKIAKDYVIH